MQVIVYIILGIVVIIIIVEGLAGLYYTFAATTCQLQKSLIFRNKCGGTCVTPGATCVSTGTKGYAPRGWFGLQDTGCTCGVPGSGVPGGTGGPGGPAAAPPTPIPGGAPAGGAAPGGTGGSASGGADGSGD